VPPSTDLRLVLRGWIVTGALPQDPDPATASALALAARAQGLAGLLHGAVVAARAPWAPDVLEALRDAHRCALVRGTRQLELLARVHTLLARSGLASLPLKGAALAETLYDSVADRPMGDVDLLALGDWPASVAVLEEAGFRRLEAADHAWSFADPVSAGVVELHHSVTSCPGLYPVPREALWRRSLPALGQIPRLPSPEDLLVQLCLHAAFQHGLVLSLVQWLDLRRLLEGVPLDLEKVRASAAECRAEVPVAAALDAAVLAVGAVLPGALREAFAPHLPRSLKRRLLRLSPAALLAPAPAAHAVVRWMLTPRRRWELVRRTLVPVEQASILLSARAALLRAGKLLRRWGLPLLAVRS
jgi:hypothetical protein